MFIFLRLLLGHLFGDFPLQTNFVFKHKQKGILGVAFHAFLVFISCLAAVLPYLNNPQLWLFIIFIFTTHLVQDTIKLKWSNPNACFWSYVMDQLFHVGIIALIFFTPLTSINAPASPDESVWGIYYNDYFILYCIVLLYATYNGYYLIRCFHDNFLDRAKYNNAEKWFGMFERAAIVSIFAFKNILLSLLIAVVVIASRFIFFRIKKEALKLQPDFASLPEFLLSWFVAILSAGLLFLL